MKSQTATIERRGETEFAAGLKTKNSKSGGIVFIIPRGEVIRNFVHSGALEEIGRSCELSLLSVLTGSAADEVLYETCPRVYLLKEFPEKWVVRFQREILEMAHGRWLWSQAAQERWRLRDQEAVSVRQKAVRISKKIIARPFASDSGLNILTKLERFSSRVFKATNEYVEFYEKTKPALVFNGSHIHSRNATQAVAAAQWLGIPTATFIFSWDNLTSQGRIGLPYDYFLVWNEALRDQLLGMYQWIKPENVFVTGTPQFDFHFQPKFYQTREEFCRVVGADPTRPIVLYSTGMANHMPDEPEIVERIADQLEAINASHAPQLLVRVYPKDLTGRFEELKARRPDILFPKIEWEPHWLTPKYEDSSMLVNTLRHCDVGINIASTISLELCMFDKPVINVGYNPSTVDAKVHANARFYDFDHYAPIVKSRAVDVAWNEAEMNDLLHQSLKNPAHRKKERKALIETMFGDTLDGNSAARVAHRLLRIAEKRD